MYVKLFLSAMATAFLIAIIAFVITARKREEASPEEVPYKKLGKALIIMSILFVAIATPLSIDIFDPRNPLPDQVTYKGYTAAEGFRVAIDYNCMGCHTIVGNGAYYAPDLGYIARRAWDPEAIRSLLKTYAGTEYMPFNLTEEEIDKLTAWMLYLRDLNTNRWPPMPPKEIVFAQQAQTAAMAEGKQLYEKYCASCHGLDGSGVVPGTPNFRDKAWWENALATTGWEGLVNVVLEGKDGMPPFKAVLSPEQARTVLEYAKSFSETEVKGEVKTIGGYSFEPSFKENLGRWYESKGAWVLYWLFTTLFAAALLYAFFYWYARG